jgi:glycosyltransferase involved in cell wall biosynthesis
MRIAIIEPYIEGIGGAQRVIADYSKFLIKSGHDVEIFTQRFNPDTAYADFKKIKINLLRPANKIFIPFIFMFRKFKGFDTIIANDWPSNFISLRNKNVVWICYSPKRDFYDLKDYYLDGVGIKKRISSFLKRAVFEKIDKISAKKMKIIFPISKTVQERTKKYYNLNGEIFYPGINFNEYKTGNYENYILSIARFVKPKRIELIIEAMKKIRNKNLKLYVIGSGPNKKEIEKLCNKSKNVKFLGEINDKELKELYSNCLAVVYIPKEEDWGLVPLEAAASEKPTIGVNEGGLRETITNNKTGFLIKEITSKKLAEKIDELAYNPKLAQKLGIEAKKYCQRFDWKNILPNFEKRISSSKLFK